MVDILSTTTARAAYALFIDGQRIGIHYYEGGGADKITQDLAPMILSLVDRACEVLTEALTRFGPISGDPAVPEPQAVHSALDDLRRQRQLLSAPRAESELDGMIADCGAALQTLERSLYAVEPLLCLLEKIPRFLPPHLKVSLQVRRYYRQFWRFATVTGDVTPRSARAALRGVGTRIAVLAGSEVYALLREDDRAYISDLQTRILNWLRANDDPAEATEIWQDFIRFTKFLRQVNLRKELLEHDRATVHHAAATLQERGDEAILEVSETLRTILGIDDALDEVILSSPSAKSLQRELRRASSHLESVSSER